MDHPPRTPPTGERTTPKWRNACLEILHSEVHHDYKWNRAIKGRFIELYRTDEHGFHLSYNFVKVRGDYRLGFGVLLSLASFDVLHQPFTIGSRFDEDGICNQFLNDFGQSRDDKVTRPACSPRVSGARTPSTCW